MTLACREGALDHPLRRADLVVELATAADDDRRHEPRAMLGHLLRDLPRKEVAMLDAVDPRVDGVRDDARRSRVGGDFLTPAVRDRSDCAHLVEIELRRVDRLVPARDPARDHDLDEVGAELELAADRLTQLVGPVGFHPPGRSVPVAAGADDRRAGRPDARALDPAALDRVPYGEVRLRVLADEPYRGHAGTK